MKDCLKIVVSGEVDSGKSTLIGRFLYEVGTLPADTVANIDKQRNDHKAKEFEFAHLLDSFEEERDGEFTLDTTQTFCNNKRGRFFLFIDVPGHKELFRNMMCGSSYADMAIMVIDQSKGVDTGTKRHLDVLSFLGIKDYIFVLNKMDLVNFDKNVYQNRSKEIADCCADYNINLKGVVPISAKLSDNLIKKSKNTQWYRQGSLFEALNKFRKFTNEVKAKEFIFPVQDVYCQGDKKVCVGNIESGVIKKGEYVNILPDNLDLKGNEIKSYLGPKASAHSEEAVGLILDNNDYGFFRGQIICKNAQVKVAERLCAEIFTISRIDVGKKVLLKCATQEADCYITRVVKIINVSKLDLPLDATYVLPLVIAEVEIRVSCKFVIKADNQLHPLGRFVLSEENKICAVGAMKGIIK